MGTKNGFLIEILLNSKLWKLLTRQNREFKLMNQETNSLAYSMILDDLLQNFSFELGIDMDNNETPFGLYWKAVNSKPPQKSSQLTHLTRSMLELSPTNDMSKQNIYNFMNLIDMDDSVPYRIKNFILDFGKDRSTWSFRDREGIMAVKNKYNVALDQSYMWGYVENDVIVDFWKHLQNPSFSAPAPPVEPPQEPERATDNSRRQEPSRNMQREDPPVRPSPPEAPQEPSPSPVSEPEPIPLIVPVNVPVGEPVSISGNGPEKGRENSRREESLSRGFEQHLSFKMNNNLSQFPRKPSSPIPELKLVDSEAPQYEGSANRSEPVQVDQQRAHQQRNGLPHIFGAAGAESAGSIGRRPAVI